MAATATGTRRKIKRGTIKRMTAKRRLAELHAFIQLCFTCMDEKDPKEISNLTGLSLATIYRLANNECSLAVRWGTVQALGCAAGLQIEFTETDAILRVVD